MALQRPIADGVVQQLCANIARFMSRCSWYSVVHEAPSRVKGFCPKMNIARDAEPWTVGSNGGDWSIAWHPPPAVPPGTAHGANGFCLTADRGVILISGD